MGTIAEMVKEFNFAAEEFGQLPKFAASLTNEVTTRENILNIVEYLKVNGIYLKPRDLSVCANSFENVKSRVDEAKSLGEIQAYIDTPKLINKKGFLNRLKYCRDNGIQYKTPEGKYLITVTSDMEFKKTYGNVLVNEPEVVAIEPSLSFEQNVTNEGQEPLISVDAISTENSGVQSFEQNMGPLTIEQVLQSPKEYSITDEQLIRFEELYTALGHIMLEVFATEEVNETMANNLRKLVSNDVADDKEVLYNSITFGKQVDQMQKDYLYSAIDKELKMVNSNSEIELGRTV